MLAPRPSTQRSHELFRASISPIKENLKSLTENTAVVQYATEVLPGDSLLQLDLPPQVFRKSSVSFCCSTVGQLSTYCPCVT